MSHAEKRNWAGGGGGEETLIHWGSFHDVQDNGS